MKFSAQLIAKKIEFNARKLTRLQAMFWNKSFHPISLPTRALYESLCDKLFAKSYTKVGELSAEAYWSEEPLPFEKRFEGVKKKVKIGVPWADKVFDSAWMHITGKLPDNQTNLAFLLDLGGEGLVCDREGNPKQGITNYASFFCYTLGLPYKKYVNIEGLANGNDVDFYVDVGANDLFGNFYDKCAVSHLDIVVTNPEIRALYYDISVLFAVFDTNKTTDYTKKIYKALTYILRNIGKITEQNAKEYRQMLAPFLQNKSDDDFTFYAMGHAHIDLAWLWPIRETIRKGGRTFASQFMNLERYPNTYFGEGQAQLYQWIKDNYPSLFQKSKEYHQNGRWELQGATWVESDTNIISGESLLRQFYYGKKFFQQEYNEDVKILWLPDTFGHSACLPAIMKLANVPYFLTDRMAYNAKNKYPSTFRWHGLDDSDVLVHVIPDRYYNSPASVYFLKEGKYRFTEKDKTNKAVNLYGIGDGGGGPGFEHYERIIRELDLKGSPKVKPSKIIDFFNEIDDTTNYKHHKGELYLEQFRGTYTTHSKVKWYNRKIEIALRNYEFLTSFCKDATAPLSQSDLDEIWKEVLLYQFHDVLPGSAINRVYDECEARYDVLLTKINKAIKSLADKIGGIINLNPFDYNRITKIDNKWVDLKIPAYGVVNASSFDEITSFYAKAGKNYLENNVIKVTFTKGKISSIFDKVANREIIPKGKLGNDFISYNDIGDCWKIVPKSYTLGYSGRAKCIEFLTSTNGAEAIANLKYKIGKSIITQEIKITDNERIVTFNSIIDYQEKFNVLRVCFPSSIVTDKASFNIQYGHIERSTKDNTPEEKAKFEVTCHKFYDLSEDNYGVSFINDCKYGCRTKNGKMYLTLFRSPKGGPSHDVDKGENSFCYALYLHDNKLGADTYQKAYEFNNPLLVSANTGTQTSYYTTTNNNIILESVQKLDDNKYAFRFYNSTDTRQVAKIDFLNFVPIGSGDLFGKIIAPNNGNLTLDSFGIINIICTEK